MPGSQHSSQISQLLRPLCTLPGLQHSCSSKQCSGEIPCTPHLRCSDSAFCIVTSQNLEPTKPCTAVGGTGPNNTLMCCSGASSPDQACPAGAWRCEPSVRAHLAASRSSLSGSIRFPAYTSAVPSNLDMPCCQAVSGWRCRADASMPLQHDHRLWQETSRRTGLRPCLPLVVYAGGAKASSFSNSTGVAGCYDQGAYSLKVTSVTTPKAVPAPLRPGSSSGCSSSSTRICRTWSQVADCR